MNDWAEIAAGLLVLILGSELLIRGATALARRLGVSELLIGLILVGFGTSAPELVASIQAAIIDAPGVAVGNVVGSNIANTLLILGVAALIAPVPVPAKAFTRDTIALAIATIAAVAIAFTGTFGKVAGVAFLAGLALYIVIAYFTERGAPEAAEAMRKAQQAAALPAIRGSTLLDLALAIGGLALLIFGAKIFVSGAIHIARAHGVSEPVIGLTLVALGTSLPELATAVMAAARGRSALVLGNVIGSNIYNLLGILGATALVRPIAVPGEIIRLDNWVMAGATLLMLVFARTRRRITRPEGAALFLAYGAYIYWLSTRAGA